MNSRTLKKAATAFSIFAALIVAFVVVVLVFPQALGAEASYVVLSGSMSPAIQPGDLVVVRSVPAETIEEGDVITFRNPGATETDARSDLITHRVLNVEETDSGRLFETKGDAVESPDSDPVEPSQLIGIVWFHVPFIGHLVVFSQTRLGLVTLVILPGILLIVNELYTLYINALVEDDENDGVDASDDQ